MLRVICEIAEDCGKPTCQPRGFISIRKNQSRKVETVGDSSEPVTKDYSEGIKMIDHERSKSRTSRFTNIENPLSLLWDVTLVLCADHAAQTELFRVTQKRRSAQNPISVFQYD